VEIATARPTRIERKTLSKISVSPFQAEKLAGFEGGKDCKVVQSRGKRLM
jgi:hypothetical protein